MKLGLAASIVVALWAGAGGCAREATPVVHPDERPPLPPSAGTPIGHLVDAAGELTLSDDQLGKIKVINDELAGQLTADDSELRPDPVASTVREDTGRGLGFHAAGQNVDGSRGGAGAFPGASGGDSDAEGPRQIIIPASTVNQVYQQRARHVREAVRRALALLDAAQQVTARRILADHGVNLDTGEVSSEEPGAAKLEDPKLGKPLPREP